MKKLNEMTSKELKKVAKDLGIKGYSSMKYNELFEAINNTSVDLEEFYGTNETTDDVETTETVETKKTKKNTYLGEIPEDWPKKKVTAWKKHYREFFADGGETVEEVTEEMNVWSSEYDTEANKPKESKTTKRTFEYNGKTQSLHAWAKELGITPQTLYGRIVIKGMSVEEAIETPISKGRKKKDDVNAETETAETN